MRKSRVKDKTDITAPISISQIYEAILTKTYTLGDIPEEGLTSRNLNYWVNKENLFLTTRFKEDKGWTRLSFTDYVWVKLLLYLSDMGIEKNDKVASIKNCLAQMPQPGNVPELNAELAKTLRNGDGSTSQEMACFAGLVADRLLDKKPLYIRLFKDGGCQFMKGENDVIGSQPSEKQKTQTYIQIALKDIFSDFVSTMTMAGRAKDAMRVGVVSNQEGTLLYHLTNGIVTDLSIDFLTGNPLKFSINESNKQEAVDSLSKHMVQVDYVQIQYTTIGNQAVSISKAVD